MDIVIVGRGNVGRALGPRLIEAGHTVSYAVRDPGARDEIPIDGAAGRADAVILAVPFPAAAEVVGRLSLTPDTILVDATNPFGRPVPGFASGGLLMADAAPTGVPVVKSFNVMGAEAMADPEFPSGAPVMPVAGDDPTAVDSIVRLGRGMGYDARPVGGMEVSGLLEEAARYWGLLAMAGGLGRDFALGALSR